MNQSPSLKVVCRICRKGKGAAFPNIKHDKCAKQLQLQFLGKKSNDKPTA